MLTEFLAWLAWAKADIKVVAPFIIWIGLIVVLVAVLNNKKKE
ncbi:MAG: hypothetical protein AABY10_01115 [Nanoarchaeota archaeon]